MKKTMKKPLVMLAWLAGACGVYAANDVWWPTDSSGNGLTGDLSSKEETGWNNGAIDFLDANNRWVLGQPGSYAVQLFGKELTMGGEIKTVNQPDKAESHVTLDIDQGASLVAPKLTMGAGNDRWDSSKRVQVAGASTLTTTGRVAFIGGNCFIDVMGGSTFNSAAVSFFPAAWQDTSVITGRVTVVDSAWTANGAVNLGGDYNHCANWAKNGWTVAATNSTLVFNSSLQIFKPTGQGLFKNCSMTFTAAGSKDSPSFAVSEGAKVFLDGGTTSGGWWYAGRYGEKSLVTILDGTHTAGGLTIGRDSGSVGELLVDGENAVFEFNPNKSYVGQRGDGLLHVKKGTIRLANGTGGWMRLPRDSENDGFSRLVVDGGEMLLTSETTTPLLWCGEKGSVEIVVNGGTFAAHSIRFQTGGSNPHVLKQTGGLINMVARTADQGYISLSGGTKDCRLELTGGVLACNQIKTADSNPNAKIVANGGTLRVNATPADPFMQNVGAVTCGPNGLGFDTWTYSVNLPQDITNASGEHGRFVKKGNGTLNLSSASYDVAETAVASGTLRLTRATPSFDTALVVTNGATFSLVGSATGVTLDALVVTNGVLALDPDDVITVTGAVDIKDLTLSFSSQPDAPKDFLVVNGPLSEGAAAGLRRAYYAAALPEGKHAELTSTYDSGTGKTTVRFEAADDADPLTDAATWTGSGDGTWGAAANWQGGVLPTAAKEAVFGASPAQKTVTVAADAVAGALSFADDYMVEGPKAVEIAASQGAARIDVTAGATAIAAPLLLDAMTYATLGAGAALTLSGTVAEGGLRKSGSGRLNLALCSLACPYGLSFAGGMTSVATEESFGTRTGAPNRVQMTGDTLEINRPSGEELVFDQAVTLAATNATAALVLKSETPATFKNLTLTSGAIIKRGPAKVTLEVRDGDVLTTGNGKTVGDNMACPEFPADGTAPTQYYAGLTVVEGALDVKSADPAVVPYVSARNCVIVGGQQLVGSCNPTMTVDHVYFDAYSDGKMITYIGHYLWDGVVTRPTLRIVNGATYYCHSSQMGTACFSRTITAYPTMIVEDSTFQAVGSFGLGHNSVNGNVARVFGRNSSFVAPTLRISGASEADFYHCVIGKSDGTPLQMNNETYVPSGTLRFRNGTVLRLKTISFTKLSTLRMAFDDSTWDFGTGDYTLSDATTAQFPAAGRFSLVMEGKGLIVAPSSGKTFTLDVPVTGEGGFVNCGEGTVAFANGRYAFTGKLVAESGVVDLSAAGTIENATIGAGAGVISGGTFHNATIALDAVGGAVPTFANCTFTGVTCVTVGGEPATAKDVTVANYTGTLTGVNTFRLKGWKNYRGVFAAEDGQVKADIGRTGMLLIIR